MQWLTAQLRALFFEIIRIVYQKIGSDDAEDAHRNIDVEDPAPVVIDCEVAAQRRADDRCQERCHAEQGLSSPLLLRRKRIEQHALTGGLQAAAGQSL